MKLLVLAFLVGAVLAQGEPAEYPVGVFCSPAGDVAGGKIIAADHPCHCANMGDPQTSCETRTTNDPVCRQYCHEQHCRCPVQCGSHVQAPR
jgi:hypothetical protein